MLVVAALLTFNMVAAQNDAVRVGSKLDTEALVSGQIMLVALESAGYSVTDNTGLGTTAVNREALLAGEIDVYPEYTGTAISNFFRDIPFVNNDEIIQFSNDAYASYATVSSLDAAINDIIWLQPAPMNNTFALAMLADFAEENGIADAQDMADFINAGNELRLASSDEFAQRPDGFPAFENLYNFELGADNLTVLAGGTPAQTSQLLNAGEVDLAMVYSTDGALQAFNFVVLEDPLGAQPIYALAPTFRGEFVRANPEIVSILNPVMASLDTVTIQSLNGLVDVEGLDPRTVAEQYLRDNGFID
ncbi:MAG: ABC transporter substrate-binding protein [Anaerolineaceae bacterium]|nr:MAG: ABC transporter substrate-binding protein [Anaerolineaceae bacterium]